MSRLGPSRTDQLLLLYTLDLAALISGVGLLPLSYFCLQCWTTGESGSRVDRNRGQLAVGPEHPAQRTSRAILHLQLELHRAPDSQKVGRPPGGTAPRRPAGEALERDGQRIVDDRRDGPVARGGIDGSAIRRSGAE